MKIKRLIDGCVYERKRRKKELHNSNCGSSKEKDFKKMLKNIISKRKGDSNDRL